jgi:FdhE protein
MAALGDAQAAALERLPPGRLPSAEAMATYRSNKMAPIGRLSWEPDESWRAALLAILDGLRGEAMPEASRRAVATLQRAEARHLETLADRVLRQATSPEDAAEACFVTAALQVYWTRMAQLMPAQDLEALEHKGACPLCGSPPIASLVYAEGDLQGVRYLVCSLCGTEWHLVRVTCAECLSTKGIAYHGIEGGDGPVKCETCDECKTYTKIVYRKDDPKADTLADDLATLGLDMLVTDAGWNRAYPNPFLLPEHG